MSIDDTVKIELLKAVEKATAGELEQMEIILSGADAASKQDISSQVADIRCAGYEVATIRALKSAAYHAGNGDADEMKESLKEAYAYSSMAGVDISQKALEIAKSGFQNAIRVELARASAADARGNHCYVEYFLDEIGEYVQTLKDLKEIY